MVKVHCFGIIHACAEGYAAEMKSPKIKSHSKCKLKCSLVVEIRVQLLVLPVKVKVKPRGVMGLVREAARGTEEW